MTLKETSRYPRRIYPLDPRNLTEEQIAVAFAMTSRRPEPFDEIAKVVSEEKAADFHERWVLNYGHASVAEHAIIHMAVENISRLACDDLEDNRLGSYTEKSSRYQILDHGSYYVPKEIVGSDMEKVYVSTCDFLFDEYHRMVGVVQECLRQKSPQKEGEKDSAFKLRIRRQAIDSCRFLLPAATLTNVGVTMNARTMEHAILKLLSSDLQEEHEIGALLKEQSREITPTLIKYADRSEYLYETRKRQRRVASSLTWDSGDGYSSVELVHWDKQAEDKLAAAALYRYSGRPYNEVWSKVSAMKASEKQALLDAALGSLGAFDNPIRELESIDYTFDMVMDYGAYREYKRHRMQTYIPQPLTVKLGYLVPSLIEEASLRESFEADMEKVAVAYDQVAQQNPRIAEYLVTHAHNRRVLCKMNLRECYHFFKLRTQPQAHFTIQEVAFKAIEKVKEKHPDLFKYLQLRS